MTTLRRCSGQALGGVAATFGATGGVTVVRRDAWGKERSKSGTLPVGNYLYTGQRWDELLGLYDYNARYYDAELGRFISSDTIVPDTTSGQSFNRFSYVRNDPQGRIDPDGHSDKVLTADDGGGGSEGIAVGAGAAAAHALREELMALAAPLANATEAATRAIGEVWINTISALEDAFIEAHAEALELFFEVYAFLAEGAENIQQIIDEFLVSLTEADGAEEAAETAEAAEASSAGASRQDKSLPGTAEQQERVKKVMRGEASLDTLTEEEREMYAEHYEDMGNSMPQHIEDNASPENGMAWEFNQHRAKYLRGETNIHPGKNLKEFREKNAKYWENGEFIGDH